MDSGERRRVDKASALGAEREIGKTVKLVRTDTDSEGTGERQPRMKVGILYSKGDLTGIYPEDYDGRNDDQNIADLKAALDALGHESVQVAAGDGLIEEILGMREETDVFFNAADEGYNDDAQMEPHLVALLDIMGVKYTGAGYLCLGTCLDKARTKQLLVANHLPTPRFVEFTSEISMTTKVRLRFPLMVKPAKEDGSIGIKRDSVVDDKETLVKKVNEIIARYRQPALVEEFIDGREVNIGLIGKKKPVALPPSEIIFTLPEGEKRFLSYEGKWLSDSVFYKGTVPQCPADIDPALRRKMERLALRAYRLMGVNSYGRVDFRISRDGKPYILEVNPNPDISADAGLARMAKGAGMSYPQLIDKIIRVALE